MLVPIQHAELLVTDQKMQLCPIQPFGTGEFKMVETDCETAVLWLIVDDESVSFELQKNAGTDVFLAVTPDVLRANNDAEFDSTRILLHRIVLGGVSFSPSESILVHPQALDERVE